MCWLGVHVGLPWANHCPFCTPHIVYLSKHLQLVKPVGLSCEIVGTGNRVWILFLDEVCGLNTLSLSSPCIFLTEILSRCSLTHCWNVTSYGSSEIVYTCKHTVNRLPGRLMPLPQMFLTSDELAISATRPGRILPHRDNCLALSHSSSRCHLLVSPLIHASFQLLFFYPPSLWYWGQDLQWKNIVYFSPHVELLSLECVFGQDFARSVKKQQSCKHRG